VARAGATALNAALACLDEAELIELTRDLIRISSVVRPGEPGATEEAAARHVERWLGKQGFDLEVQQVAPGRPNVLAWLGEKGSGKSLLLEGHTDVVTEGNPAEWTHPPFGAELVDGRIYGRGAADMKSGLAAAMAAATAIKRSGAALNGRLVVGALVDEEGDMLGAKHLCTTTIGRELDAAIICEPEQNELCLEQRGVVWARVAIRGHMAHGAMPEAGVNPITALGALLNEIPTLERRLRKLCRRSPHLRPPTVTPTIARSPVQGVEQANVIPSSARMLLDVRLTPGPDEKAVAGEIDEACRRAAARCPGPTIEWAQARDPRRAERAAGAGNGGGRAPGHGTPRRLRRCARLDRRDHPPDAARHPDRHVRSRTPPDPPPGRRVRGSRRAGRRRAHLRGLRAEFPWMSAANILQMSAANILQMSAANILR
jgi:succinyl-diaminopimelate desuccinylase